MEKVSFLDSALMLARMGFHVFPLQANSKLPAIKDYPTLASCNETTISEWWGKRPYCNIGISTSSFGDGKSALLVIDIDNKPGKEGDNELFKLELEGKEFPPTLTQKTPTNGRHLVYKVENAVKQGSNVLAPGLDTRSRGGYIVGCGSSIEGKLYAFEPGGRDIADAPKWLVETCNGAKGHSSTEGLDFRHDNKIDSSRAWNRGLEYLRSAPHAHQGQGGDQTTYQVICKIKDLGVSASEALEILTESGGWNDQCLPPWGNSELEQKIRNAYTYGMNPPGISAPEKQFDPIPPTDQKDPEEFYLDKMNKEYALVYIEGSHFILHETVDRKGRPKIALLSENTFYCRFKPQKVMDGKKEKNFAESWINWKDRREYAGLTFSPEKDPGFNYYNLWKGFTTTAIPYAQASALAKKGFDAFMDHVEKNVCNGDKQLFKWLMGYFAHLIQKPFERPLTTIVFRGEKGTGKNALIDRVGKLLGEGHYLVAHDSRYLTSNFNGHLDSCLCLVLDEAFWSGDKTTEGKLKGITTSPEIMIERKGKEPYMVDNLVRLVVIGNEDWLVPASHDERRYAVFNVGSGRKQDNTFFENMRINMDENGGNAILLDHLKRFDLSTVDPNKAPATAALYDQKTATQDPFYQWWLDCLTEQKVLGSDFGHDWPDQMDKDSFRHAFNRYAKERNVKGRFPTMNTFGKLLKKCCPSVLTDQKRKEGERWVHTYRFPNIVIAREEWQKYMGHEVNWD
jgi:hypothetical protein